MVENGKETKSKGTLIKKGTSQIVMESESETGDVARFIFRRAKGRTPAESQAMSPARNYPL